MMKTAVGIMLALLSGSVLAATVQLSELKVRELLPGRTMTAGYLILHNTADQQVDLVRVSSPGFAEIELHEHVHQDGMMKMQKLERIAIPAGSQVSLQPGGLHLMMFDAKAPLASGQQVILHFSFSDGSSVEQPADVVAVAAHH